MMVLSYAVAVKKRPNKLMGISLFGLEIFFEFNDQSFFSSKKKRIQASSAEQKAQAD